MMNKKHLPQIGAICYITFKVSETETTECLGYLDISQVEDEVEDGFIDEDGNYFKYFFHIPAIDKYFEISQLVSWRDINGWISVKDALPEPHKAVLVINSEDYFLAAIRSDGEFHLLNYGRIWDVTHWQPLPLPPTK